MSGEQTKNIGLGIGALLLQVIVFRHLDIWSIQPDLVLIFLVWLMGRKNRTVSLLMAGLLGIGQDFFLDLWGLNMFTKTLTVYLASRFVPQSQKIRLSIGQVSLTVLAVAVLHNLIFQGLNISLLHYSGEALFWRHLIGNSLYTALCASFIYLFRVQK
ncbi:MAG TPA: rod shape-determining protein MreD [Fodinibius sp.]|nr:rod shape-determining protein MreD [Fodinibius sp.]